MPYALQSAVKRGEKGQAVIEGKRSGRKELFLFNKRGQAPFLMGLGSSLILKKNGKQKG
jgi:hypothetical protein